MNLPLESLAERVHQALRLLRSDRLPRSPLTGLQAIEFRIRRGATVALATYEVLDAAVQTLGIYAPEPADLIRARFFDGKTMEQIALQRAWSVATLYAQQKEAILEVARILIRQEETLRQSRLDLLDRDLVSPSTAPLIGITAKMATLLPVLTSGKAPWLLALTGPGGIGKTTMAEALVRELVVDGTVDRIVWVSAKQEMMSLGGRIVPLTNAPQLTPDALLATLAEKVVGRALAEWQVPEYEQIETIHARLRQVPHLLVIDNIETTPNIAALLPLLRRLAIPSKILLTSRVLLPDEGDIFAFPVPPLTESEAHQLLLQEAEIRHIPTLSVFAAETAHRVFEVVGGNPLALRLVAGQIGLYGVDSVLEDLRHATGTGEHLYKFLYEWTWQLLPELCRRVLLALALAPDAGYDVAQLTAITALPMVEVKEAIAQLTAQNLLLLRSPATPPLYAIHHLTRTFLQEAFLKW